MFKWIKKILRMDNKEEQNQANVQQSQGDVWPEGREFELEVFDMTIDDRTGKQIPQRVSYSQPVIVKAFSKDELNGKLQLYRTCDQIARIVREIPGKLAPLSEQKVQQPVPPSAQAGLPFPAQPNQTAKSAPQAPLQAVPVQQPQYFKIGDIEIKIENGQSYQKQFVALTEAEAKNIRVVDDKTNRVINLNGKHIEMKKWIQVQSTSTDELSALEQNLTT